MKSTASNSSSAQTTPLVLTISATNVSYPTNNLPPEPPEVVFIRHPDRPIPMHPHIYTNGIICLDLLASQGWSPVQNVESVCLSIQSMLTGNSKKERPPGDAEFVRTNRLRPRDVAFHFHDNEV
jgi:ubiquitin-conjugating enzyme E2 W